MNESRYLPAWIMHRLEDRSVGRATERVLTAIASHNREISFASAAEAAEIAGVNPATVVRTAQLLGFSGWPALRSEVRSRYLSRMSASEVLAEHDSRTDGPAWATLKRNMQSQQDLAQLMDEELIHRVAQAIFNARVTLTLGSGSFAAPGIQLAHLAQTVGHDVRTQLAGGTSLVNAAALLGPGDCLVVFHLWRTPVEILKAIRVAADSGVHVVLISDRVHDNLGAQVHELVPIPSEGASMFPSLTAAITIVEATIAALVDIDRRGASAHSDRVEQIWREHGLFPENMQ